MKEQSAEPKLRRKPEPEPKRRMGFVSAAALTPAALRTVGAKRGFAELRLVTEWESVVGPALASLCRPLKVSYRGGGGLGATLVVSAEGARAPELEMQAPSLLERVNAFYGYRAVARLRIDQSRAGAICASGPAARVGPPEPPPPPVEGIGDERLALALARLGANVRAKAREVPKGRMTE